MKYYMNLDTGLVWSEDEVRQEHEQFAGEDYFDSFEDALERLLDLGRQRVGGLIDINDIDSEVKLEITYMNGTVLTEDAENIHMEGDTLVYTAVKDPHPVYQSPVRIPMKNISTLEIRM